MTILPLPHANALIENEANADVALEKAQLKLAGVDGSVQGRLIERVKKMIDTDPQKFANAMRGLVSQDRPND